MRIVSILTAVIVSAVLFLLVMERDRVLSFAGRDAVTSPESDAQNKPATDTATTAPSSETETVKRVSVVVRSSVAQPVEGAVLLRGRTEAARQVEVRAETSGTVISDPLRKGAFVKAGQPLCEIDPGIRPASLSEAEARLAEAKTRVPESEARLDEAMARLEEAEINDRAALRLKEDGFATETRVAATTAAVSAAKASVQSAKSGLDSARSGIRSAEAAVATVKKDIERLTIKAPFEGLLETDGAELGSLLQPGGLCAVVIQLDPIKLVGFVPETDVDKVTLGTIAGARLASGRVVQGPVTFLGRAADPTTRTFRVEADIVNVDLAIRDGQTAEISISSGDTVAHLLPQSSMTLDDDGQIGVRVVDTDSRAQFVPVAVIRDTAKGIWVTGLPETAEVIVVGQEFVTDGVPVKASYQELGQ